MWFGAAAPLGLLASKMDMARAVALTHGHEVGWAMLPVARGALRRIGRACDVVTYLTSYQRDRLAPLMSNLERLVPGVDSATYHPGVEPAPLLRDRPVIVCVSRLVARKGQDTLIKALPLVRRAVPDAALLLVGGGPYRSTLERLARDTGVTDHVHFTGSVPWESLPNHYAAGQVFAMPCRTRNRGLDVEGLGIVYLEASAIGLPVIAGDSGGAPDAVRDGETGYVVPGRNINALADRLIILLRDPALARKMGTAGREWVESEWGWDHQATRLQQLLT